MTVVESTTESPMSPLVHLRITYRRVANTWRESESLPVFVLCGAIVILLGVPLVVLVWKAGQ